MNHLLLTKAKENLAAARELLKGERHAEALEKLKGMPPRAAGPTTPLYYQTHVAKGVAALRVRRFRKAETALKRAAEARPELPLAWKTLCELYELLDREERAAARDPRNAGPAIRAGEGVERALEKAAEALERLGSLVAAKGKRARAQELFDRRGEALVRLGRAAEAAEALRDPRVYELQAVWPRLEALHLRAGDEKLLEALYRDVGHRAGLLELLWRAGRVVELAATAQEMVADGEPHWACLETLLALDSADGNLVELPEARKGALCRRLAFAWPERPLAWAALLPDEEVETVQLLLLGCASAIPQWLRVARLRLRAQQPLACLSAVRHGIRAVLRMSRASFRRGVHPLASGDAAGADWDDLPRCAHESEALLPASSPLSFRTALLSLRLVQAQLQADAAALQQILDHPLAQDKPLLRAEASRALATVLLHPARPRDRDLPRALSAFRDVLSLLPSDAASLAGVGWALHLQGDSQSGSEQLFLAVEADPNAADHHHRLGIVLSALEQHDAAHQQQLHAARLDPTRGSHFSALGHHYLGRLSDSANAARLFRRALTL
ncbi:MAG TPA: hypothetical protein VJB16_01325, partial [archaeon]|nr:hypothetical protein [archaeon]